MDSFIRALKIVKEDRSERGEWFNNMLETLQNGGVIDVNRFDLLGYDDCCLATQLIVDWRVVRYYFDRLQSTVRD